MENKMQIKQKIEEWVKEVLGKGDFQLVHPKDLKNGDFSLIVEINTVKQDFEALRQAQGDFISEIKLVKPRFINFFLTKDFLDGQKIFIEHTQPNPFKEFHIGHLMNNTIGESVSRIIKINGAEVKTASYHGDVGLHVAKAIWGKMQKPELAW